MDKRQNLNPSPAQASSHQLPGSFLTGPWSGTCRVEQQQYRVDVSDGKTTANVKCLFSRTQELLFVLLPREVR